MKRKLILTFLILLAFATAAMMAYMCLKNRDSSEFPLQDRPLKVAVLQDYKPFSYIDERTGERTGFEFDLANAMCETMKASCTIVPTPYTEIISSLRDKKIDVAVVGMGASEERKKFLAFSETYLRSLLFFITKDPELVPIQDTDIGGLIVGVWKDTLQHKRLARDFADTGLEVKTYQSNHDVIEGLLHGEVNMVLVDGLFGYALLKRPIAKNFLIAGNYPVVDSSLTDSKIAVDIDNKEMLGPINLALIQLQASGELQKLLTKYFPYLDY